VYSSDGIFLRFHSHVQRAGDRRLAFLLTNHIDPRMRPAQFHRAVCASRPHGCWALVIQRPFALVRVVGLRLNGARGARSRPGIGQCHG